MAAQPPSSSKGAAHSPDRASSYEHAPIQQYYTEGRRYSNGHSGAVPSPPIRSPTATRSSYFGYEGRGERSVSGDHSPSGSMNPNWGQQGWQGQSGSTYNSSHTRESGFDPEGRGYRSPPLHRSALRSPRSPSNPSVADTHHPRYPTVSHEDPLHSPTRSSYPSYVHSDRVHRSASAATPMNGTREESRQAVSPQVKHAPIPPPPSTAVDEYPSTTTRSGAMSISSLLTTEAPPSPTVSQTTPASRHSNIQLTASSSRPQRRKSSMDIPAPNLSQLSSSNKKRKREGEPADAETSRAATNGKFPKIKFKSSAMEGAMEPTTEEESDGLDDAEFITQHDKYIDYYTNRSNDLLKAEEERLMQVRNVIDEHFVHRLEGRMKAARRKAYQFHYEAAMSKVLHEEARRKEEAKEAKKNKKRKLLPVVEDPVVKVDRRKTKAKRKSNASTTNNAPVAEEEGQHTGFVIRLKGNIKLDDAMEVDDGESPRRHSFLANRPTPRYIPPPPQPPPGESLTASEMRAYDRMAKATEKRFDHFISSVWKDIAKKDVPKAHRQMDVSLKAKQSNAKKTVQLAAKEARRWQARSTKASKEMQIKAKKAMREMLVFWRKNEKEERDLRKKAEKEAIDRAKREEELREARRQARKLNFLITQTELYSHFVGKKVGVEDQGDTNDETGPSPIPSGSGEVPARFEELDFDADDDEALRAAAARSAQNAVQLAQNKAKDFDAATRNEGKPAADIDMKDIDIDAEDLNFTNPTGLSELEQIPQPKMLHCQLKEYQLKGLNWLVNLYEQGINGILADEMGLGKTVQSISVMAYLAENHNVWGPFLVIAPASTLHNWQQEITRFVPGLKALPYWGNAKDRKVLRKFWNRKHVTYTQDAPFHVLITSYQLVVQDEKYFQKIKWQYMILDEAQAIKSSSSSRWKILLGLHCRNRLLLTGTPIQNTMQELWALLHFIMPTLFDSHEEFSEWFSKDIESHTQSNTKLNQQQLRRLHMILKPFMLRRNKKDVQSELPAKIELDVYCSLSYRQRAFYKTLRDRISIGDLLERAMSGEAKGDESLMNLVMQFRKVCNHPDLFERADVRSPLAFSSFGVTGNIAREGPQMSLAYTTRSRITYNVPKLVYRDGGMLNVPGEDSDAGVRRRYLDHLMNIWQPDYIESSAAEKDSAFSFLRFVDVSAGEMAKAFQGDDISLAIDTINRRERISASQSVFDDGTGINQQHMMLLVPGTVSRFPLKDVTNERVMDHLCNIANDTFRSERLHIMDPMYDNPVFAPPIDIYCSDRTFTMEQNDILFDSKSRRALFGVLPLEEAKLAESGETLDLGAIPPQGLLSQAVLERSGYSGIRVPEMHRFVTDSGKLATLDRLLAELKAGGHRVLLYFQMTRMMDLIEEYLTYRQYKYLRLDGSSKIGDRRDMVMDWQTRNDLFVFVLSTRAGGLGINLTAADTVIFYDSDWNPTVDSQAMDRAHRLGQTKQVTVYRMITRNSIEERILLRAKQKEEVQRVVISGNAFKETEVDFNKGNSRDVVSWLLDDDELEEQLKQTQAKREAEEAEAIRNGTKKKSRGGGKKKLGIASLEGPAASRTLEDLYHEGEGNFEDVSARASGTATPASVVESGPVLKKAKVSKAGETHKTAVKRSHKRRSAAQAIGYLDGDNGDVEMTDA